MQEKHLNEQVEEAIEHCHAWLKANEARAPEILDGLYQKQTELDIRYRDRPIPTFLRPCFITRQQREKIQRTSQILLDCAERFIELFVKDESVRPAIGLSAEEERLAVVNTRPGRRVQVARPDSFMHGERLKYLEFNSDSPAGVAWTDLHEQVFLGLPQISGLAADRRLGTSSCRDLMLEAFLESWRQFGGSGQPRVAIVDWRDVATSREFYVIKEYFERQGIETIVADPRDMELIGEQLYADGQPVDLVYRRVIIGELLSRRQEKGISDFLGAFERGLVCVLNPFSSRISGSKAFMAVLSDEKYDSLFNGEQNRVRAECVPWTRVLCEGQESCLGQRLDLFEFVRASRNDMVIKPTNGYGGKEVNIGREVDQSSWEDLLHDAARRPGYWTVQEYVDIPEESFPTLESGLCFEDLKVNLNPYLFAGRYAGSFVRLSKSSVINVTQGGGMVPVFVLL